MENGRVAACNGWIMNHNPFDEFPSNDKFFYLRRMIIAWGDLIKLRYGNSPKESPTL